MFDMLRALQWTWRSASSEINYHRTVISLVGCAALGGSALSFCSPWGLGLSPDSAVYIGAARSLLQGAGFSLPIDTDAFAPIVHYPPFYPVLLALFGVASGADPIAVACGLNVVLFSINIFLAGMIAFTSTASIRVALITSMLVATAFPMVLVHSMAWSEPLFVFFELCGIRFLLSYFSEPTLRSLSTAAIFIGLSILSRYAGLALLMNGAAGILLLGMGSRKKRVFDAVAFVGISALPIALWVMRNHWVAGSATNRVIGFHPVGLDGLGDVVSMVVSWFSGFGSASFEMQIVTVCLLLAGSACLYWTPAAALRDVSLEINRSPVLRLMALITGNYLLLLFLSLSILDAQTPIDSRILSPIYIPLILFTFCFLTTRLSRSREYYNLPLILSALALLILCLQLPSTFAWLRQLRLEGIGYSDREWTHSRLVRQLSSIDSSVAIFSNAPDVVYTLLGRPATMIPRKFYPDTKQANRDYNSQITTMKQTLKAKSGLLVYFDRVRWRWYLPSPPELEGTIGLRLLNKTEDGSIYGVN